MYHFAQYFHTEPQIQERVARITGKKLSPEAYNAALKTILGCIDYTTLEGSDTTAKIISMCKQAKSFELKPKGIPNVAAVCFYPVFAQQASRQLANSEVKVAAVAGGFPAGQIPLKMKIEEVKYAAANNADEIDVVISRGLILSGKIEEATAEIAALKEAAGKAHLKVILETGELESVINIRTAAEAAINGGADFIKTSTGKISVSATPDAVLVMLDTIKEYYDQTGKMIGIKPAGGISEPQTAIHYYLLVKEILGEKWLNKDFFRIGASRLAGKVHAFLNEQDTSK
jgi:deoxyribose-phosphate aldolase